jgi:cyclic pyranopterin phosphate synthase
MAKTVIALREMRTSLPIPPADRAKAGERALDLRGRGLHDLRISVTDRCNFRCVYCMPKEVFDADYPFLPHDEVLTFEEIVRVARAFHGLGVQKIRLTGGEPLLRKDVVRLVEMLRAAMPSVDLTLTTNGSALKAQARALREAGLDRVTVSLDSLDDRTFRAMNDVDFPVAKVLEANDAATAAGTSCASSSTWTWARPTAGAWTTSCRPRRSSG